MLHRRARTALLSAGILLAVYLLAPVNASAGFLLGAARITLTDTYAEDLALGDLDGNGLPDAVVISNQEERLLLIHPGTGGGTFGEPEILDLDSDAWMVRCGDMDNDGDIDLVMFSIGENDWTENYITVLLNDGSGGFPATERLTLSNGNYDIENGLLVDLNHDGNLDLAALDDDNAESLVVFFGNGNGTLTESGRYQAGSSPMAAVAEDLDGDGNIDFALASWGGFPPENGSVHVLYGRSDGTFEPTTEYPTFPELSGIDSGDLDGDGNLDLVAAGGGYDNAMIVTLTARGDRTFRDPVYYEGSMEWPTAMALDDRTGDGLLDAMVLDSGSVHILSGNGDGTFEPGTLYSLGPWTDGALVEDVDFDGWRDVVTFDAYPGYISVLLSRSAGTFSSPSLADISETTGNGRATTAADFNNDGIQDLAVCMDFFYVDILLGNGDGTYQAPSQHQVTGRCQMSQAADLDQDGNLDLVVACGSGIEGSLCILPGNGDGTFGDVVSTELDAGAYMLAVGHLDGDSFIDAVMHTNGGTQVLHGDGAGGLVFGQLFIGGVGDSLGDLDEDGDLDLVSSTTDPHQLVVHFNNGSGVFGNPEYYDLGDYLIDRTLGDFNGDGHVDVAGCGYYTVTGILFYGDGTGALVPGTGFPLTTQPWRVTSSDMNGDGLGDLVVGTNPEHGEPHSIDIYLSSGSGFTDPPEQYYAGYEPGNVDLFDADNDGDMDIAVNGLQDEDDLWVLLNSSGGPYFAAGPGATESNPSEVRTFDPLSGDLRDSWTAYGANRWGVNVALGELNGGGQPEVLTGAGPGAVFGPHVRGFDGSGTPLPGVSFLAYGTNKYGVNVAAGDVDGDGFDEIITGAGPGAVFGPHVRGWNWDGAGTPTPINGISYFAYGTPKWGVNVSCGDIDGDGYDEIVTGAGPGAVYGPHVRGWNCDGSGATAISAVSFLAYGTNKYGVNVCCGDIDGDGIDEMVTGAGPGEVFGPHVRAWNWDGTGVVQSILGVSFFAYSNYSQWGVNVSCGDLDNDGIDEILTGPGPGAGHAPRVRGWNYDGQSLTALGGVDFFAFDQAVVTHGVKVAGVR